MNNTPRLNRNAWRPRPESPVDRHPFTDGWKIAASLFAGPVALAIGALLLVAGLSYCAGRRNAVEGISVAALRDTVRLTDSVRVVVRDTLRIYQRRVDTVHAVSDSLDALVKIRDDSTIEVKDSPDSLNNGLQTGIRTVVIPPLLIADIRGLRATVATQDTLLGWWARYAVADSAYDRAYAKWHEAEISKSNSPRWGVGVTLGYGCGVHGCGPQGTVGLTYQARLPRLRDLLKLVR